MNDSTLTAAHGLVLSQATVDFMLWLVCFAILCVTISYAVYRTTHKY